MKKKATRACRKQEPIVGEFPSRVVLATGFPWANGTGPYYEVTMRERQIGGRNKRLKWPRILWSKDVTKYRLVLERIG